MVAMKIQRQSSSLKQLTSLALLLAVLIAVCGLLYGTFVTNCDVDYYSKQLLGVKSSTIASSLGYSLAAKQSYGFFNDIPDEGWRRMQEKARNMVQYRYPKTPEVGFQNPIMWYLDNLQPDFTCPYVKRVGGHGDGPKWTCDPHRLKKKKDCLIYSIGSEGNYNFEESMIRELGDKHCEIHVFDPGPYARSGDPQKNNIHYHQWGLKSSYDEAYNAAISLNALGGAAPALLSFQDTLKKLGHEGRTIDIFKIDCEKCEWANYKDWITQDIRQILIENHGVPSPNGPNLWFHKALNVANYYDAFTENNFAMFSKEVNVYGGGNCLEFSYVKLHPDFWGSEFKANMGKDRLVATPTSSLLRTSTSTLLAAREARTARQQVEPSRKTSPKVNVRSHRSGNSPRIPKQIILTYKWNVIDKKSPELLLNNTINTVSQYAKAWGMEKVPVWFLDDRICRETIQLGYPELLPHFDAELHGPFKGDICRTVALHLTGGYYFDVDLEVIKPYTVPNDVGFVTANPGNEKELFQAFIASEPGSLVLSTALDAMVSFYQTPAPARIGRNLGPTTLYESLLGVEAKLGKYELLEEISLNDSSLYPELPRRPGEGCCCNNVVHDPLKKEVHFYSRVVGASSFCKTPGTMFDPIQQLAEEAHATTNV